jgi:uncharacterized delta-60 repeat protein
MKRIFLITNFLLTVLVFAQPGSIDLSFNSIDLGFGNNLSANNGVLNSVVQSDGKIILVGDFTNFNGISTNRIVRLNTDGSIDDFFNIGSGANQRIRAIAIQSDGKIIIGGDFTTFNSVSKNSIVRLNVDGSIDNSFNIGSGFYQLNDSTEVNQILILSNEKIIITGSFISYNGTSRYKIVKINNDGTIDTSFNTNFNVNNCDAIGAVGIQSDGKLIIGGQLVYGGKNNIVRLNSNGNIDNTFNQTTTTFVGANNNVYNNMVLPGGKIIISGYFTQYNGTTRNYVARLNSDGSLDTAFNLGLSQGTNFSNACSITKIQNDGKMIIQGGHNFIYNGVSINRIARLNPDFTIDNSFNIGSGIPSSDGAIYTISIQSDGKYIIGGTFNSFNGYLKSKILRLNIDGSVDNSFNTGTGANGIVRTTNIQPDGKILTGGEFSVFNGNASEKISRLNTDGLFDVTFSVGTGANGVLQSVLNQSDGKIIIGGDFTSYNGTTRNRVARLNSDGTIDTSFNPGNGANGLIRSVNIQPDGKIIIGGNFTSYNGTAIYRIARLNTNGTLDTSFSSGVSGPNTDVLSTLIQSDGKIIISGFFTSYNGIQRNGIARLNVNGSIDGTFAVVQGANNSVLTTSLQSDGKIIIGGNFTSYNGTLRNKIARLNTDGTIDNSFNPGNGVQGSVSSYVNTISLQNNGKIIIGGNFSSFNGNARNNLVQLNTNGTIDNTFNIGNGPNGEVRTTSIQSDGKIIIGGDFTAYNGIGRNRIARINGDNSLSTNLFNKSAIVIYPNPSCGVFMIQSNEINDAKSISIYTILGQKIYDAVISSNETAIDISNQPKGVYIYKVFGENGETKSGKLVIE